RTSPFLQHPIHRHHRSGGREPSVPSLFLVGFESSDSDHGSSPTLTCTQCLCQKEFRSAALRLVFFFGVQLCHLSFRPSLRATFTAVGMDHCPDCNGEENC